MPLGEIPIWGQWGILGLSLGWNIFYMIRRAVGDLVSRKEIDQVQKTADGWQHAWEIGQQTNHDTTALLAQLTVTAQTMEKVLNALPPAQSAHVVVLHNEEPI